ncbi:MAG: hypothetical protein IT233_03150 [Bacteroidia bacterium]|nr:hypothetical protein [Bacteroidia bacterium]
MEHWLKRLLLSSVGALLIASLPGCGPEEGDKDAPGTADTAGISVTEVPVQSPKRVDANDPRLNGIDYLEKYPDGVIRVKGYVVGGLREGTWMSFYPDGSPWSQNVYLKGKLNGATVTYYENGKVRYKGFYRNDQRSGHWQFFDEQGNKVEEMDYNAKP